MTLVEKSQAYQHKNNNTWNNIPILFSFKLTKTWVCMVEFMEKNLSGSRFQLYKKLNQGVLQGGGNTAPIETETLREMTQAEVEKAEAKAGD